MTQSKHTQGPWSLTHDDTNDSYTTHRDRTAGAGAIAHILHWNTLTEANARLIAAAPEMLEALREVEHAINRISTLGLSATDAATLYSAQASVRAARLAATGGEG